MVNSWLLDRESKSEYHITISIRDDGLNYKWTNVEEKAKAIDATVQVISISSGLHVEILQHSQFWVPHLVCLLSVSRRSGEGAGAPHCGDGGDGEVQSSVSVTPATVYEVIVGSGGVAMKHSGVCGGNGTGSGIKSPIDVWAKGEMAVAHRLKAQSLCITTTVMEAHRVGVAVLVVPSLSPEMVRLELR